MLDENGYTLFVDRVFLEPTRLSSGRDPEQAFRIQAEGRQNGLQLYSKLTGFRETNVNAIYHHRRAYAALPPIGAISRYGCRRRNAALHAGRPSPA